MIGIRIMAIIAAASLVLAFALATSLPPDTPLIQAVAMADQGWLTAVQDTIRQHAPEWVWTNVAVPLLLRPVWLAPTGLAIVAGGVAITLSTRQGTARSRRRRS